MARLLLKAMVLLPANTNPRKQLALYSLCHIITIFTPLLFFFSFSFQFFQSSSSNRLRAATTPKERRPWLLLGLVRKSSSAKKKSLGMMLTSCFPLFLFQFVCSLAALCFCCTLDMLF
ncbi:hypothetical protein BC940DRAFT_300351 [Gongronella butleri]|nr:hypothetical protein BC940DRAFT_300351 [Gongronella butleri]